MAQASMTFRLDSLEREAFQKHLAALEEFLKNNHNP